MYIYIYIYTYVSLLAPFRHASSALTAGSAGRQVGHECRPAPLSGSPGLWDPEVAWISARVSRMGGYPRVGVTIFASRVVLLSSSVLSVRVRNVICVHIWTS